MGLRSLTAHKYNPASQTRHHFLCGHDAPAEGVGGRAQLRHHCGVNAERAGGSDRPARQARAGRNAGHRASARERLSRNAARFEAVHHILSALSERLRDASDAPTVFRELGFCEQTFESDLREWMRLMVEAEWFG